MAGRDDEKTSKFVQSTIGKVLKKNIPGEVTRPDLVIKEFVAPVFKKTRMNQVVHLQSNVNRLKDLHSRLRFMIKELEDLVQK